MTKEKGSLITRAIRAVMPGRSSPAAIRGAHPYNAADVNSQEMSQWHPALGSADGDYLWGRDTVVARTRDLIRNSGWTSSALTRHLDNVIGVGFRPSLKPNWRALGLSQEWAEEWSEEVESRWKVYADDPQFYIDAQRKKNFTMIMRLLYRDWIAAGESLMLPIWDESKPFGRARTSFRVIDPDRLSNPHGAADSEYLRAGISLNEFGAPQEYHIRKAHPGDFLASGSKAWEWESISRYNEWGRQRVIHAFEETRADQTRGISRFASVIERVKMLDRYEKTEVQAALLNAIMAAFIESPFDEDLAESLDAGNGLTGYQQARSEYHNENKIRLNGMTIARLFPGEKFKMDAPSRPNTAFAEFERACLRNIAAGVGVTYEQMTMDWSQVNYSSARAALQEIWKTMNADRSGFARATATPMFILWLEEQVQTGEIKLPKAGPDFYTGLPAYADLEWIGTGRGYVDPEKEAKASNMRINTGISTLEDECAEQGKDWKKVMEQRAKEKRFADDLGLTINDYAALQPSGGPTPAEEKQS